MFYDGNGNFVSVGTGKEIRKRPYWIMHLDCGRKKWSVSNIKIIIDNMSNNGLNQLQLHFSETTGFRFALDDMTVITKDGVSYDLSTALTTTTGGYLTEDEMDTIIEYAYSKGIDIVPSFNMPGHMTAILNVFTDFRLSDTLTGTLNVKDDTAVEFALAIVRKYARYFQSRGCKFWNIGADEVGTKGAVGRWEYLEDADIPYVYTFINKVMDIVERYGMIPRLFNEPILYNSPSGDYSNYYDREVQVYCWGTNADAKCATTEILEQNDYSLINCSQGYYLVLPTGNGTTEKTALESGNLLKTLGTYGGAKETHDGCCFCVWCDSDNTDDGGDSAMSAVIACLNSFGKGITASTANIDYPVI